MKMGHLTKIAFVNTMAAYDLVLQENRYQQPWYKPCYRLDKMNDWLKNITVMKSGTQQK